ncbi:tetratricopeptide repeat protein 22-like [Patiria miniata]|uniref:Uncharacterized protein n=1 Tax=Patiria miniata TaxID=46514 RepID=A0A913YWM4_PATMI|nr:tetratricopeptide repeat protein 22-like [Patiria miniata]
MFFYSCSSRASNEEQLPPAGHFNLPLPIATDKIVKANAGYKRELFEHHLERRTNYCANCNLLGVLAFTEGDEEEALKYFKMALDEDPKNLNALANINHVKGRSSSEKENSVPDLSTRAGKIQQARCYAEQAYPYIQLYHGTVKDQQYEWYNWAARLYKEAFTLAGSLVDRATRHEWLFSSGLASFKILEMMVIKRNEGCAKEALRGLAERFGAIVDSPSADNAIKCKALMHVAVAFEKASRLFVIPQEYIPKSLVKYIARPEKCLRKARDLSPDDALTAKILVRLAQMRQRPDCGGSFEEAMELLNESIALDPSKFNFLAYSSRASLCIKQYRRTNELRLLSKARRDLEFILPKHESPWDLEWLAEVYYHLAKRTAGKQAKKYIRKALETCTRCKGCQDGKKRSGLHHVRGQILCLNGQHQEAMESFQKGVACEEKTGWISGNMDSLREEREHVRKDDAARKVLESDADD